MNEQKADLIKTKRFEQMRKKLNEELKMQGNINSSMYCSFYFEIFQPYR